jgi:hypothetical protein
MKAKLAFQWGALPDFTERNNGSNNRCAPESKGVRSHCLEQLRGFQG